MPQTSYTYAQPVAFEGMGVDTTPKQDESFYNSESTLGIGFGRMVQQGAGDFTCLNLTASTNKLLGIALYTYNYDPAGQLDANGGVLPKNALSIRTKGRIWVWTEEAVTPASLVQVRYATGGGGSILGRFRATAVGSQTIELYGANWITSAGANSLAQLQFNMSIHLAKVAA